MPSRAALLAILACLLTPSAARPQGEQETPQAGAASIRVTARAVVLDVVVTNKDGSPYTGTLTRDDFQIFEDGVAQSIRSFEPPSEHRIPGAAGAAGGVTQDIVHSAADLKNIGDAPVDVLVLDELNTRFEDMSFARNQMIKYLKSQPAVLRQPTVLLIATNNKFVQVHDYTQNRDELVEVIQKHMPEVPYKFTNGKTGSGAVERMAAVIGALQQIAQATSGTPGRKNIIWVGNGFPAANLQGMPQDEVDVIEAAYRRVVVQLLASHATMYTINPTLASTSTVEVEDPEDVGTESNENGGDPFGAGGVDFTNLATNTGGKAFGGRNDINNVIGQAIDAGQNYYTLSYSPTNKTDDAAKFRKIRIVLKDRTLRATTRDGYYQPNAAALNPVTISKDNSEKQVKRTLTLDLSQALTSAMSYNGLDVSVDKGDAGAYTLTVKGSGIGWSDPGPDGSVHEEATIAAAWYDAKGKVLGHVAREAVAPRPSDPNGGATFTLQGVAPPPNATRLRFVVRDANNGHMGTADITKF